MPLRMAENPFINGYNQSRSGDIIVDFSPNFEFEPDKEKANHSTLFSYDTHVPMLFYGWHVKNAEYADPVFTIDIAPTITNLLKITEPSGCIGIPLLK
jgi:arylsulfatase A-like enzyme